MIELPPLPEPEIAPFARADANDSGNGGLFSRDQMRAYGEACARAALEAAATECDAMRSSAADGVDQWDAGEFFASERLSEQIRALTAPSSPSSSQTQS
jgi:hypothetical protein